MFTRFPAHGSADEGTEDLPCELGAWKKMFLQSCRPAPVLPDNKVAMTEQSQGVISSPDSHYLGISLEEQAGAESNLD